MTRKHEQVAFAQPCPRLSARLHLCPCCSSISASFHNCLTRRALRRLSIPSESLLNMRRFGLQRCDDVVATHSHPHMKHLSVIERLSHTSGQAILHACCPGSPLSVLPALRNDQAVGRAYRMLQPAINVGETVPQA